MKFNTCNQSMTWWKNGGGGSGCPKMVTAFLNDPFFWFVRKKYLLRARSDSPHPLLGLKWRGVGVWGLCGWNWLQASLPIKIAKTVCCLIKITITARAISTILQEEKQLVSMSTFKDCWRISSEHGNWGLRRDEGHCRILRQRFWLRLP